MAGGDFKELNKRIEKFGERYSLRTKKVMRIVRPDKVSDVERKRSFQSWQTLLNRMISERNELILIGNTLIADIGAHLPELQNEKNGGKLAEWEEKKASVNDKVRILEDERGDFERELSEG